VARVLITGTSKGIGRATALEAIKRGHEVVGTARNPSTLDDIDGLAARLALDVTEPASVEAALNAAGEVDALVSNAGETTNGPVETTPVEEYRRLFELNTIGSLNVAQPLITRFREQDRGRFIFVSSVLGRVALPFKSPYAASKWALEAIAEALAAETGLFGLHVSLIEPGPVSGTSGRATARQFFSVDGPYQELLDQANASQSLDSAAVSAEDVAATIVDTLEAERPALHVPVGTFAIDAITKKYAAAR
jgi:NAD(P)-dependent dehydrogenase (short-subunit alcohol dehydrogenase family)